MGTEAPSDGLLNAVNTLKIRKFRFIVNIVVIHTLESFRFGDEDEDEDEALCFRHNEIFKLFRLQLGRDDEVDCNNIVTPSLSRI